MARQTGPIQLTGSLGGLSFYRHKKYGMLARMCNPVSAERIAKDPAFARTRENGTEFGLVSRAGKLLRDGFKGFLGDVQTEDLDLRVMRFLLGIKAQDTISLRGQRQVGVALELHPELLGGFSFHSKCGLDRFLVQVPIVDRIAGTIAIRGGLGRVPPKATHVVFTGFRGSVDFSPAADVVPPSPRGSGAFQVLVSESISLSLAGSGALLAEDIVLQLPQLAGETGIEVLGMKIVFLQEINGVSYVLKTGAAGILVSCKVERPFSSIPTGTPKRIVSEVVVPEVLSPAGSLNVEGGIYSGDPSGGP